MHVPIILFVMKNDTIAIFTACSDVLFKNESFCVAMGKHERRAKTVSSSLIVAVFETKLSL